MAQHPGRCPARKDGDQAVFDATGSHDGQVCPRCGSDATITYHYEEGFEELECSACGYISDSEELGALQRFSSELLESDTDTGRPVPVTGRKIKA